MKVCKTPTLVFMGIALVGSLHASLVELFRDEFGGNQLDITKWNAVDKRSVVNDELQYYSPANLQVANGSLEIVVKQETKGGASYTSGRVDTKGFFDFVYGIVEIRAKLPKGRGIWASVWLEQYQCAPAVPCLQWPPAISLLDFRGDQVNTTHATLFYKGAANTTQSHGKGYTVPADLTADFHIYRLQWSPTRLVWALDGQPFLTIDDPKVIPTERMQLVMNVAVGGAFPGLPDDSTEFPLPMSVDYVRVSRDDGVSSGQSIKHSFVYAWICVCTKILTTYLAI